MRINLYIVHCAIPVHPPAQPIFLSSSAPTHQPNPERRRDEETRRKEGGERRKRRGERRVKRGEEKESEERRDMKR